MTSALRNQELNSFSLRNQLRSPQFQVILLWLFFVQWLSYSVVLVSQVRRGEKTLQFVMFTDFYSINILIMANYKLPRWCHQTRSWEVIHVISSQSQNKLAIGEPNQRHENVEGWTDKLCETSVPAFVSSTCRYVDHQRRHFQGTCPECRKVVSLNMLL